MTARGWGLAAAAALVGALLYANTIPNEFVFDDIAVVRDNPFARDPSAVRDIFLSSYWAGAHGPADLYRPITILSLALNRAVTGEGAAGYHVVNALLHGLVSGAVVLLAMALGLPGGAGLAAGLLFAAHPVHVEAVAPVVGRSELLAALSVLAAWLVHLRARRGAGAFAATIALFGVGLLSKENAIVFPALAALAAVAPPHEDRAGRPSRSRRLELAGLALLAGGYVAARAALVPAASMIDPRSNVYASAGGATRLLTSVGVLGRYLGLLVFPRTLSADYSYRQIEAIGSPLDPLFLASAAAHVALLAAGLLLLRRGRLSGLGILIYLVAILPASNLLVPTGTQMAERLLYLPSVGLCLAVAALFGEPPLSSRPALRRAGVGALALAIALFAARTVERNRDWSDQLTLFSRTAATSPRSAKVHFNYGHALGERGDHEAAIVEYRRALEIQGDLAEARHNLGRELLDRGDVRGAIDEIGAAARLDAALPDVRSDLGLALARAGRLAEAESAYRQQLALHPEEYAANMNLGILLLDRGDAAAAIPHLDLAVKAKPADADARGRQILALALTGRPADAIAALDSALAASAAFPKMLVPFARAAVRLGLTDLARAAAGRGAAAGAALPEDLRALLPAPSP
ncbi:MAG: tetratricopeptide repeat protein [Acidobacteria bacterium]|nr:tetratricopeptide repeat protein [Acidobacteriota bacterium]